MEATEIKKEVRERYGRIAKEGLPAPQSCCCGDTSLADLVGEQIGYTAEDMAALPEGANLGVGCGNPVALASLSEGETVLDLGSGAGIDCFLAAKRVGEGGRVIGASDENGTEVADRPVHPAEVIRSIYEQLGIDPEGPLPNHRGLNVKVMPNTKENG